MQGGILLGGYFYNMNLGVLFGSALVFLFLVCLCGLALGRKYAKKCPAQAGDVSDFVPSTILGLLSLIMGFTFSMAITRFDHRKELVLKESNAIGTVLLRSALLNSDSSQRARSLLRQYVDARLAFFGAGSDFTRIEEIEEGTRTLHDKLWELVVQTTQSERSAVQGLFVSAVNDVIDLQAERLIALRNTVPEVVYWVILLLASIGLSSRYFAMGMRGKGSHAGAALLAILFALVFALIHDLDRPRAGITTVSQEAMLSLRRSL